MDSKLPFFSIIIPVYNVAPYLRECLDSVLAQAFTDWEAICVDDGSTDGSGAILDEYAAKDKRFKVIHQANAGVSAARNKGLDCAAGEYVVFVDGDDVVDKDWLETFKGTIDDTNSDIIRAGLTYWSDGAAEGTEKLCVGGFRKYRGKDEILTWGVPEVLANGYPVLNCIRSELAKSARFPVEVNVMEDCIYGANVMTRAETVATVPYCGYKYRLRQDSAIHNKTLSPDILSDLNKLFISVGDLWGDVADRILEKRHLVIVERAFAKFVFHKLVTLGAGNRKRANNREEGFKALAATIRDLVRDGAINTKSLEIKERFAVWLFYRFNLWRCLILLRWIKALSGCRY